MKRLVRRCQGWTWTVGGHHIVVIQCPEPATLDGVHCDHHRGVQVVEWMEKEVE